MLLQHRAGLKRCGVQLGTYILQCVVLDEPRVDYTQARGLFSVGPNWFNWLKADPAATGYHSLSSLKPTE